MVGADTDPPVILALNENNLGATSVEIEFVLEEFATGQIEYGVKSGYGSFSKRETAFNRLS